MEHLPHVESAVDSLFWDRDDPVKRFAALELLLKAAACEPGVEAIRAHGGIERLRKALAWDDEEAVDIAAAVLAQCSGSTARSPGARTFEFSGHTVRLRETDYVEGGLGWRVWASGVVMCRELIRLTAENKLTIKSSDILELGSGCGVAGFLCAKLGASRVTFTDYLPGLLDNLDKSVTLQLEEEGPVISSGDESKRGNERFRVHYLEWLASCPVLSQEWKSRRPMGGDGSCSANADETTHSIKNRFLPTNETFPLIIGSDVCYEDPLPSALAATIDKRLANPGTAYLVLPVRDWPGVCGIDLIDKLVHGLRSRGMNVDVEKAPDLDDDEYQGGTFVKHPLGMVSVWVRRGESL